MNTDVTMMRLRKMNNDKYLEAYKAGIMHFREELTKLFPKENVRQIKPMYDVIGGLLVDRMKMSQRIKE